MQRLDVFQESGDLRLSITPGSLVSQQFTATKDNLSSLRLPVFNPNLGSADKFAILLRQDEVVLRKLDLTGANLGWGDQLRFDFEPIATSQGQTFTLELVSLDDAGPDKGSPMVAYSHNDTLPGELTFNGQTIEGDLRFSSFYTLSTSQWPENLVYDLASRLALRPGFVTGYIIAVIGISVLAWKFSRQKKGKR